MQWSPGVRLILTVSPVPLVATYEDRHVLISTTYSKSVLRVAAETVTRTRPATAYFPSYEIITGPHAGRCFYEDDLREVREEAVAHVMSIFVRHYLDPSAAGSAVSLPPLHAPSPARDAELARIAQAESIICDEKVLDRPQ